MDHRVWLQSESMPRILHFFGANQWARANRQNPVRLKETLYPGEITMIDPKAFDDLAKRFAEAVPPSFRQFQAEMEKNFHAALQATLAKLELVTREEFDVQQAVLARTRAKLEELEKQVTDLETKVTGGKRRKSAEKPAEPDSGEA